MRMILAALAFLAASCAKPGQTPAQPPVASSDVAVANGEGDMTIEERRAKSLADIDRAACDGAGGDVRQEGMLGLYRCVKPYADAGKACRDDADCEGQCRFEGDPPAAGSEAGGVCQRDDSPFGCYSTVEDGRITGGICVD